MATQFSSHDAVMQHALALAERGRGAVEPNPCVGAVIVDDNLCLIGEGYHQQFGGPHAEINAINNARSATGKNDFTGTTIFVTLEPCSHHGKTPPCSDALVNAGFKKVFVATQDPAAHVNGQGISRLKAAGIAVDVGLCEQQAKNLIAPFTTLMTQARPFMHAKWAMTLDGKIATHTGHSQWISNEQSREIVHQIRGRMDAIVVGIGTALADNPALTARPAGPRVATRVIMDRKGRLPLDCQLVRTAREIPVLVMTTEQIDSNHADALRSAGVEVVILDQAPHNAVLPNAMKLLGDRKMTNILVEGGSELLGDFFHHALIDEFHIFIAPKIVGGKNAFSPIAGIGSQEIPEMPNVRVTETRSLGDDLYLRATPV